LKDNHQFLLNFFEAIIEIIKSNPFFEAKEIISVDININEENTDFLKYKKILDYIETFFKSYKVNIFYSKKTNK